jgi:hypothetical protein
MHVVGSAIDAQHGSLQSANNAAYIRQEVRADLAADQRLAMFGAEYQMDKEIAARLRHVAFAPSGLAHIHALPRAYALGCILTPLRGNSIVVVR